MATLILITILLLNPIGPTLGLTELSQSAISETLYDSQKDVTTVRLPRSRISGDKGRYHSLDFSVFYNFPGKSKKKPEMIQFELVSVVKARKLNSDLYVVFLVDGDEVHFGSNRSAIRNPVKGRPWIGEQMIFAMSLDKFQKLANARMLAVKMGGVVFPLSDESLESLRRFSDSIITGTTSVLPAAFPQKSVVQYFGGIL